MSTELRPTRPVASALKWLILAALVWSQFALAVHQLNHEATETGNACSVCLQFERDEDAVVDAPQAALAPALPSTAINATESGVNARCATHFRARASP